MSVRFQPSSTSNGVLRLCPKEGQASGRGSGPHPPNPPSVTRPPPCPAPHREALCIQRKETEVFSWCCSKSEFKRNVLHLKREFGREMALCPLALRIFFHLPAITVRLCCSPSTSFPQTGRAVAWMNVKATWISPQTLWGWREERRSPPAGEVRRRGD